MELTCKAQGLELGSKNLRSKAAKSQGLSSAYS